MKVRPAELLRYEVRPSPERPGPPDWAAVFGRRVPRAVELGFGNGEYLAWWAQRAPELDLVGIEKPAGCLLRAARGLARADASNVRLLRGDGRYLLRELFPAGSLRRVLMQFPMPWPKGRHAKHRVSGEALAATLADVLEPGGEFEMVTDQLWFAEEVAGFLHRAGRFRLAPVETGPERPFRTRYERKWLGEGRAIHRFTAELERPQAAARILLDEPMWTPTLDPFPAEEALRALAGRRFRDGERVAEVKDAYSGDSGWIFRVVTADGSFSQVFYLQAVPREGGRGTLKVADGTPLYYTAAVRMLLESAAKALAPARHVGATGA